MKHCYPAILTYAPGQEIAVTFPDLGCATCGENDADALASARELLKAALDGLRADGEKVPPPTPPEQLRPAQNERVAMIAVDSPLGA